MKSTDVGDVPNKLFFVAMTEGLTSAVEAVRRIVGKEDAVVPTGAILSAATAAKLELPAEGVWPL